MSYEEQDLNEGSADGAEGVDDLTMALSGGGEANFVTETKQPMSKGTMVVAGLLVACGAVTYFMYVRNGPAEAAANPDQLKAQQVVEGFLSGPDKAKEMRKLLENTEKVVQEFRKEPPQVTKLAGNPFEKEKPKPDEDVAAIKAAQALEKLKTAAKEAAGELKLQTIIHKDPKKAACMINQRLLRKGERISAAEGKLMFTIAEIRSDAVTLSVPVGTETLKFELKMKP